MLCFSLTDQLSWVFYLPRRHAVCAQGTEPKLNEKQEKCEIWQKFLKKKQSETCITLVWNLRV